MLGGVVTGVWDDSLKDVLNRDWEGVVGVLVRSVVAGSGGSWVTVVIE